MRRQLRLIFVSLWALGACAQPAQNSTAPPATPQPTAALARPAPPTPQATAALPPAQEQQQAALEALTLARQGGRFSAVDGQRTTVLQQPLSSAADPQPRWLAFSLGHGSGHTATLYRWQASGWPVLSSAALNAAVSLVNPADIAPVTIAILTAAIRPSGSSATALSCIRSTPGPMRCCWAGWATTWPPQRN